MFKSNDLDIELDGTKPTFAERRRIHTGADHHHATPPAVVEEPVSKWPTAIHHDDTPTAAAAAVPAIPKATKLARAKSKGNERIIRLGQVENKNEAPILSDDEESKANKYVHRLAELEDAVQQEQVVARRAASVRSRRSKKSANEDKPTLESTTSESTRRSSDAFRRKIEAMRKEAGTEWLRVLQEMDVVKKSTAPTSEK